MEIQAEYNVRAYDHFFGRAGLGPMPHTVTWMCCPQFAVTREAVRIRTREFYIQSLHFMRFNVVMNGNYLGMQQMVGRALISTSSSICRPCSRYSRDSHSCDTCKIVFLQLLFALPYSALLNICKHRCLLKVQRTMQDGAASLPIDSLNSLCRHINKSPSVEFNELRLPFSFSCKWCDHSRFARMHLVLFFIRLVMSCGKTALGQLTQWTTFTKTVVLELQATILYEGLAIPDFNQYKKQAPSTADCFQEDVTLMGNSDVQVMYLQYIGRWYLEKMQCGAKTKRYQTRSCSQDCLTVRSQDLGNVF